MFMWFEKLIDSQRESRLYYLIQYLFLHCFSSLPFTLKLYKKSKKNIVIKKDKFIFFDKFSSRDKKLYVP